MFIGRNESTILMIIFLLYIGCAKRKFKQTQYSVIYERRYDVGIPSYIIFIVVCSFLFFYNILFISLFVRFDIKKIFTIYHCRFSPALWNNILYYIIIPTYNLYSYIISSDQTRFVCFARSRKQDGVVGQRNSFVLLEKGFCVCVCMCSS